MSNWDAMKPLTPEDLVPSPGIEPVTLKIWAEPGEDGVRFALVTPQSQVGSPAADLGQYLAIKVAELFTANDVPFEAAQGKVH